MANLILGIETSCDETAAAVVKDGRVVLSNIINSQADLHKIFGGVVPEIASRKHTEAISTVVHRAISEAGITINELDAIAVTAGPGLVGALLVGVSYAKALAYSLKKPLLAVHHIEGHIAANYVDMNELTPPFICLVASGGHSHIVHVKDYSSFEILGQTRDDAAGEAFDKAARVMGLGYPGGPLIDLLSKKGTHEKITFPKVNFGDGSLDFSFSGVKTALVNFLHKLNQKGIELSNFGDTESLFVVDSEEKFSRKELSGGGTKVFSGEISKADIAASFQYAVVSALVEKTITAAQNEEIFTVTMAGGVAANTLLRSEMKNAANAASMKIYYPSAILCTDNAAMIACAGYFEYKANKYAKLSLNATPYISLCTMLK